MDDFRIHYMAADETGRILGEFFSRIQESHGYLLAPSRLKRTYTSLLRWNQDLKDWYVGKNYRLDMKIERGNWSDKN